MVWLNARVSYRWGSGRGVVLQDRVEQEVGLEVVVRARSSSCPCAGLRCEPMGRPAR